MTQSVRFSARRDGRHGAKIKDLVTNRIIGIFPEDPKHPEMAEKFAAEAAKTFNDLTQAKIESRRKMGFQDPPHIQK